METFLGENCADFLGNFASKSSATPHRPDQMIRANVDYIVDDQGLMYVMLTSFVHIL